MARAFALKESVTNFAGGSASYGDGQSIDLGSALAKGDGVIVASDELQIKALSEHPSLKQVAVPKKGGN